MNKENASVNGTTGHAQIDTLIVLDRSVDLFSPLLTPLTYEGLIDELFGVKCGRINTCIVINDDSICGTGFVGFWVQG